MRSAIVPRVLGGLTAMYGAYTLARPQSLIRAAGLQPLDEPESPLNRKVALGIGARDLASGAAMVLASPRRPLQMAIAARVACDLGDAVGFGLAVPPRSKGKVIAVAIGWGVLCASAFPAAGRTR
ncbi:MAG: hypothetical protein ACXV8K_04150 [Ilumatobacteraceae bacterium]